MKLPVLQRTSCDCESCTAACRTMPGSLVAGDLERILEHVQPDDPREWILTHFVASTGASGVRHGRVEQVGTIVPRQREDGSCVFLRGGKCAIHDVSPFGCRHFDVHMSREQGELRARVAITMQARSHETGDQYARWWRKLKFKNLTASPMADRKRAYRDLIEKIEKKS